DSIVYDNLMNVELLSYARADANLFYVGKKGGDHFLKQEKINELLVEEANKGFVVARIKGGDPFIFGRGGEEAEVLARAGISFEIVPGVTSAIAVPAYAGIPLTHRDFTSTLAFVTGHESDEKSAKKETNIDWQSLAKIGTVVFLMGMKNLSNIVDNLIANGKVKTTPTALIREGTSGAQETIVATLAEIYSEAKARKFLPPAILVVGEVVTLKKELDWFETKPLFGKGVMITRPQAQAQEFATVLQEHGANVIHFPVIDIEPIEDFSKLDEAIARIEDYAWIIFTSANGVRYFFQRLWHLGKDARACHSAKICAIGPATALEIERFGIKVDLVPKSYISEGIIEAFVDEDMRGKKVLLPRAEIARDVITEALTARGATVDVIAIYRAVKSRRSRAELQAHFDNDAVDVITFTSPSTVTNFLKIAGGTWSVPEKIKTACIGPITASAMKENGIPIDIMQETYTIPALAQAIADYFGKE
ncbi:MAG: uroporphyrinogen-III C-methyltransferase, partial [Deltaproteobacteria bacterium]